MTTLSLTSISLITALAGVANAQPEVAETTGDTEPVPAATEPPAAVDPPVAPPAVAATPPTFDPATIDALVDARLEARLASQPQTAGYKDGFFLQTGDGATKLKIGGFTQFDGRFFVADTDDPHIDQFGFRSIRPDLQGTVFDHFDFRLLPDFAGGRVTLQDVYLDVRYSELFKVRFGKFKVPFGLERLQGETATTFVERGLPTLLTPNRDLGVQAFGELAKGLVAYQVGVFNGVADGASGDADVSDDKELAARVFVKPFATSENALVQQLGIGGAVTYGDKTGTLASPDVPSLRTQGQTQFFGYRAGTTVMETVIADGRQVRGTGQASWYGGPVGLLAEYVRSSQQVRLDARQGKIRADAWQVLAQWVITGEAASFKSVVPERAFDPSKGQWGAVDIAARVGGLRIIDDRVFDSNLADPAKSAQRAVSAGGGLDWFPNKNFRFALDLEHTRFEGGAASDDSVIDRPAETSIVGRVQTVF